MPRRISFRAVFRAAVRTSGAACWMADHAIPECEQSVLLLHSSLFKARGHLRRPRNASLFPLRDCCSSSFTAYSAAGLLSRLRRSRPATKRPGVSFSNNCVLLRSTKQYFEISPVSVSVLRPPSPPRMTSRAISAWVNRVHPREMFIQYLI